MADWLAALIVAVVYGATAGVLALQGRAKVKEAGPAVPEQTIETVKEDVEWAKTQTRSAVSKVSGVSDATPSTGDVKQGARKAKGIAQDNPLGLAVAGVALGFLIGTLVPGTRLEDEKVGPLADDVKEQARQTGHEALQHGKEVAQSAAESAAETAKQEGSEHGRQVADSARESAQQVSPS